MRRSVGWSLAGTLVLACALPKVEIDESLAAGATGGTTTLTGGAGGKGGAPSQGGSGGTLDSGGTGLLGGQAGGASDDPREVACGDYCPTYLKNCRNSEANDYTGLADCLDACFTDGWPLGDDPTEVNSLQCRVLHSHLAEITPVPHCFHSARVPTGASCAPPP